MSKKRREVQEVVDYLRQGPERSTLFWWLAENHDELVEANGSKPIRWGPLATRLASYGLADRDGKVASAETTRLTWKRVRQFVAKEKTARAAKSQTQQRCPSRLPVTWRPETVAAPMRPLASSSVMDMSKIVNNDDCTPEESLAGLKRILAERSGR